MGESITEGTILEWRKKVGDTIEKDETLLEIGTDKVDSEIPSTHSGKIVEILAEPNDVVEVGIMKLYATIIIREVVTSDSVANRTTDVYTICVVRNIIINYCIVFGIMQVYAISLIPTVFQDIAVRDDVVKRVT